MSLSQAMHLAHNMRARATERGDSETAELAQLLHEIARGLEDEQRDIKRLLQDIQHRLQNLH